ncbi:MAG: hypothetical protein D6707_11075, partial [Bacteroidetes bacterium]
MTPFLKQAAAYILKNHTNNLHLVKVVLPNKRARVFFEKYLTDIVQKPLLPPEFDSIENFMVSLSGYRQLSGVKKHNMQQLAVFGQQVLGLFGLFGFV